MALFFFLSSEFLYIFEEEKIIILIFSQIQKKKCHYIAVTKIKFYRYLKKKI